jgi:uncharacterized protein
MSQTNPFLNELHAAFVRGDTEIAQKKTESANVETIQRLYEAFFLRDLNAVLQGLEEDVDWHIAGPEAVPFAGACRGRLNVAEVLRKSFATVADQRPVINDVIAQGDTVTVIGREQGRCQPNGNPYEGFWIHVFTLREGKVAKFREYFDTAALLQALQPRQPWDVQHLALAQ